MKRQNNHSFDISTFDTIIYRIYRGKLAILIEDGDNRRKLFECNSVLTAFAATLQLRSRNLEIVKIHPPTA